MRYGRPLAVPVVVTMLGLLGAAWSGQGREPGSTGAGSGGSIAELVRPILARAPATQAWQTCHPERERGIWGLGGLSTAQIPRCARDDRANRRVSARYTETKPERDLRGASPNHAAAAPASAGTAIATDLLDAAAWEAAPAEGVELHLAADRDAEGKPALRLDYDFRGRGGWAAARRRLALDLPTDYELRFSVRAEGPPNRLEIKLVDPTGENVWWHVRPEAAWAEAWTPVRIKKRQIAFAWGPAGGGELRHTGALEFAVTAGSGGRGSVWIAGLALVPRAPVAEPAGSPRARASSEEQGHPAALAVDGDPATAWRTAEPQAELTVDLGAPRELGGFTLFWEAGRIPRRFRVDLSEDGAVWIPGREVRRGGAARSDLLLTESEARFLRLRLGEEAGEGESIWGLAELVVRPLAWGASPNAFFEELAREAPRGAYPRGFSGEQSYWTVVGADGDPDEALFSEDGALEVGERGFSLEPFVQLGGKLWTWADVTAGQSLADGDLPIPTVTWPLQGARLEITALAASESGRSALLARYRLRNSSGKKLRGRLFVAARPFQVNPPQQFLNVAGGVAPLGTLSCGGSAPSTAPARRSRDRAAGGVLPGVEAPALFVADVPRVWAEPAPTACGAMAFDEGPLREVLAAGGVPASAAVDDDFGYATAVLAWDFDLPAEKSLEVILGAPFAKEMQEATATDIAGGPGRFAVLLEQTRRRWRQTLDGVGLDLPPAAAPLARTLRTSLAYILIHRDGPALQPGSRAYARSWIRDGALTGSALLRLGRPAPAREFAEWFAGFQYPDGKVPCCVDRRGADPVPEHDSHGELVHLIAEVFRYTHDRAWAERLFPHVEKAVDHIETLRQTRRTAEYREGDKRAYFGLLPESISHEGYSAKPVHSYWDDLFAYHGLADAAELAAALGRTDLASRWAARRDEFRRDLLASLALVMSSRKIDYLPGSADLADFDSTSTTIALDPAALDPYLPRQALTATFERFYREFAARRDGISAWDIFTPYEVRHVGAFVRLGWKSRAHELLAFYLGQRRPAAWNQWSEAVRRDPRAPGFLGDLPHGWVASDFIRSTLDLFAYERRDEGSLVLAAGIPEAWLARPQGIAIRNLATPWGPLSYRLARRGNGVRYTLPAETAVPPGGLILTWPLAGRPGSARADGHSLPLAADGTVVVRRAGIDVDLQPERVGSSSQHPPVIPSVSEGSGRKGGRPSHAVSSRLLFF